MSLDLITDIVDAIPVDNGLQVKLPQCYGCGTAEDSL